MMRASTLAPALAWSRQWAAAWRATAKWPLRCTRTTASHSSSAALANMRSRTKPALLTTASRPSNAVDGGGDDAAGALEVGDVVAVGDRLAARRADLVDHLAGRPGAAAGAVELAAEVVHHDPRALPGELERVGPTEPAPRSGHDHDAPVADAAHALQHDRI